MKAPDGDPRRDLTRGCITQAATTNPSDTQDSIFSDDRIHYSKYHVNDRGFTHKSLTQLSLQGIMGSSGSTSLPTPIQSTPAPIREQKPHIRNRAPCCRTCMKAPVQTEPRKIESLVRQTLEHGYSKHHGWLAECQIAIRSSSSIDISHSPTGTSGRFQTQPDNAASLVF